MVVTQQCDYWHNHILHDLLIKKGYGIKNKNSETEYKGKYIISLAELETIFTDFMDEYEA